MSQHRPLRTWLSLQDHGRFTKSTTSFSSPNSLLGLPTEIQQAMFSSLADVTSLKALILTCSSLYHAFIGGKSFILKDMLQSQIDPQLLQNALITLHASRKHCQKMIPKKITKVKRLITKIKNIQQLVFAGRLRPNY